MAKGVYIGVNTIQTSLGSLEIGSIISLNIANTPWEFIVVHQGKPSSMYDDSCDGTWLLLKNVYTSLKFHNSYNNSYAESALHSYLNNEFLNMFDANIQSVIKSIKIPYHNGQGTSGSVASGASGLSTKIFALSGYEVNFTTKTNSAFPIDGACLSYFSGTSLYDSKRIAYLNSGSTAAWWLRSPMLQYSEQVWCVHTDGGNTDGPSSGTKYIRPAMILPSNLAVKNGTIDGSVASTREVARKVKKGYIGVPTLSSSLGGKAVGDIVKLNVGGVATNFIVVNQGNPDGTMYDASCDGTWLMMEDIYEKRAWDSSNNDYANSDIHAYLNGTFLGLFDSDIQPTIKQAKIPYLSGAGSNGSVASGALGLSAKIFLLSGYEVGFNASTNGYIPNAGVCLSFFSDASNSNRIAYLNSSALSWSLRTPHTYDNSYLGCVEYNGSYASYGCNNAHIGIRPALILPSNLAVDSDGNVSSSEAGWKDVARKIKKAYIGIGGVARPCWSGGKITLYGEITSLPQATRGHASASIGNYAMFAGGYSNSSRACSGNVYTYDSSLTVSTLSNGLDQARTGMAATTVYRSSHDDFVAFFGGGIQWTGYYSVVDCYDGACTKMSHGNNLTRSRQGLSAKTVGNYGVFAGGKDPNGYVDIVDAFNPDSSQTLAPNLSKMRGGMGSASIGGYALFAGGSDGTGGSSGYFDTVDAYDSSLTRTSPTALSVSRGSLRSAVVGDFALFAGGSYEDGLNNNYISTVVDIYNSSLTRTTATDLSVQRSGMSSASMGEFAIFVGGEVNGASVTTVDIYDSSLTRTVADLPYAQHGMGSATAGQYTIFAGGTISNGNQSNATEKAIAYIVI